MMGRTRFFLLALMLALLQRESVNAQSFLQVQLLRYENTFNLEFRPNNPDGPFCCCNMATPCFPSVQNFSTGDCTVQCGLRVTICLQSLPDGAESCRESEVQSSPSIVDYTSDVPMFPDIISRPSVEFTLDDSFTGDFSLVVTMEEQAANGFDIIDVVTVEIGACNLSSPAMEYPGMHGIASATLAYIIATTTDRYRNCIEPDVVTETRVETETETQRMTETETVTERTTVQVAALTTVNPLEAEGTEESSSPWKPIAIVLIVILGLAILATIIVLGAACYIRTRRTRDSKEVTSYNPVHEEAGVSPPPKQGVIAGEEVVPGIFTNLSEEILAAVPSLDEIDGGNADADSFLSGPDETAEQPSTQEHEKQHPEAEVHMDHNSQLEDQDPIEGLYAFEK